MFVVAADPAFEGVACFAGGNFDGVVGEAETDAGQRPGTISSDAERLAASERENRELRRANQILKSAASFFAAELDRPSR